MDLSPLDPSGVVFTLLSNAVTAIVSGYVGVRKSRSDRTRILFDQHDKLAARIELEASKWKAEADSWRQKYVDSVDDKLKLGQEISSLKNQMATEVADCRRDKIELEAHMSKVNAQLRHEGQQREKALIARIVDLESRIESYLTGRKDIRERVTALEDANVHHSDVLRDRVTALEDAFDNQHPAILAASVERLDNHVINEELFVEDDLQSED